MDSEKENEKPRPLASWLATVSATVTGGVVTLLLVGGVYLWAETRVQDHRIYILEQTSRETLIELKALRGLLEDDLRDSKRVRGGR